MSNRILKAGVSKGSIFGKIGNWWKNHGGDILDTVGNVFETYTSLQGKHLPIPVSPIILHIPHQLPSLIQRQSITNQYKHFKITFHKHTKPHAISHNASVRHPKRHNPHFLNISNL